MLCVMISTLSYADNYSCPVPYYDSTVQITKTSDKADVHGQACVTLKFTKTINQGLVSVLINVYDADTDKKVKAESVDVNSNNTTPQAKYIGGLKAGHSYYFKIHSISCR